MSNSPSDELKMNSEHARRWADYEPSIFISHSSHDIAVARAVRNLLEDRNHRFVGLVGLASLEDKDTVHQCHFFVDEIASRDWLILIDSESAQESLYVQFEIATAKVLRKPFYTIDGNRFVTSGNRMDVESSLRPCVESLSRGLRVFISYSIHDALTAESVADWLVSKGFETFTDRLVEFGEPLKQRIDAEIQEVAEYGVIIALLSNKWLASKSVSHEIESALKRGGIVLPIVIEPLDRPIPLNRIQHLDISAYESVTDAMDTIWYALNRIRHEKFKEHCGGIILNDWPGIGP